MASQTLLAHAKPHISYQFYCIARRMIDNHMFLFVFSMNVAVEHEELCSIYNAFECLRDSFFVCAKFITQQLVTAE